MQITIDPFLIRSGAAAKHRWKNLVFTKWGETAYGCNVYDSKDEAEQMIIEAEDKSRAALAQGYRLIVLELQGGMQLPWSEYAFAIPIPINH